MSGWHFRIILWLVGDTQMTLCTVLTPDAVADVLRVLCSVANPEYTRIEVVIFRPVGGV